MRKPQRGKRKPRSDSIGLQRIVNSPIRFVCQFRDLNQLVQQRSFHTLVVRDRNIMFYILVGHDYMISFPSDNPSEALKYANVG